MPARTLPVALLLSTLVSSTPGAAPLAPPRLVPIGASSRGATAPTPARSTTPPPLVFGPPPDGEGEALATIGDLFGDGASDYAVGSPWTAHDGFNGVVLIYDGNPGAPPTPLPSQTLKSHGANCEFGASISAAGDVNGDGRPDLLIGAPTYQFSGQACGQAYLYLGTQFGFSPTPSWQFDTGELDARVGESVSWAGDVNGDGYDDWLVGAPGHTNGQSGEGIVYLFLGGPGLLSTVPAWSRESDAVGAAFGAAVSGAGDVNADGYGDIVIGAPNFNGDYSLEGAAWFFLGGPQGPSQTPARVLNGYQVNQRLGASVSTAGDVNADGYSDYLVGAPGETYIYTSEGVAHLYLGGPDPAHLPYSPLDVRGQVSNSAFGAKVATAGDVNGDGYADIVVGAPAEPQGGGTGIAYLFLGEDGGLESPSSRSLSNQHAGETFAVAVGTLGDIDGDGLSDWAGGRLSFIGGGGIDIATGWRNQTLGSAAFPGSGLLPGADYGNAACTADVDGDGFDDLVIAGENDGTFENAHGVLQLFRGSPQPFQAALGPVFPLGAAPDWTYEGGPNDQLGIALARVGDVNADGYEDFAAGAPFATGGRGRALLFYGSPGGPGNLPSWELEGGHSYSEFGFALAGGDFNGDGFDDLAVGMPTDSVDVLYQGRVAVYLGSALGLAHDPAVVLKGARPYGYLGAAVACPGDVNRDGFDDLVVGEPSEDADGEAYLYLGSPTGVHAPASQTLHPALPGGDFGYAISRIGDVNGDGYADVFIAAPFYSNGQSFEGEVFVFNGSPSGLVDPAGWSREGDSVNLEIGREGAASAGDFDGDGYSDMVIGLPRDDTFATDGGRILVFGGGPAGLGTIPLFDFGVDTQDYRAGAATGGDCDFNGDGIPDLYLTVPGISPPNPIGTAVAIFGGLLDGSTGRDRAPGAFRTGGGTPIAPGTRSNSSTSFALLGKGRSAAGRTRVRLEYEAKPQATPFDFAGRVRGPWQGTNAVAPGAGSSVPLQATVTGLSPASRYHWRARYLSASPYFPATPWFGNPERSPAERHVVTAGGGFVAVEPRALPGLELSAGAPNPFVDLVSFSFRVPTAGRATLALFDVQGRLVRRLFDGVVTDGVARPTWDGRAEDGRMAPVGAYFARLEFAGQSRVTRVVRLRGAGQ